MEAEEGIEPSNDGFANHCLTTWLLRHSHGTGAIEYVGCGWVSTPGIANFGIHGGWSETQRVRMTWARTPGRQQGMGRGGGHGAM